MNQHVAPPDQGMTDAQRADLGTLLAQTLPPGTVHWLGERILGPDAILDIIGNRPNVDVLAKSLVDRMHETGRLADAIAILRTETRNGTLLQGLNHILAGFPLAGLAALQANVQAPDDPFFNNDFVELHYPRVQRTVCAIGLGPPVNALKGTGFLIAPDLVMTNFHVVVDFVKVQSKGDEDIITSDMSGENVYFFFDYLSAPRPLVPPEAARPHSSVMVRGAKNWLVRARCRLPNEGVPPFAQEAKNKYDYAVVRLEKPIGNLPSRKSGGARRGWLPLDSEVSFLDNLGSRLVVFQHPGGAEQLWDVGVYSDMDPSKTRIWYSVNTERGASGGPAVDSRGRLYALHNASVHGQNGVNRKLNQGVRVDVILSDLKKDPGIDLPAPVEEDIGYWSLSENVDDPRPIIGRQLFRDTITRMMAPNSPRILAVIGPKDTGRHFSVDLLKRIVGAKVPIVPFTPVDLSTLSPRAFIKALASELALPNTGTIPEAKPTESAARSISVELPKWLADQLAADQARNPSRYPAWIVIDTVVPEGQRLIWADGLLDLVSALMGPLDVAQATPELPQLRWLLLGAGNTAFPPTRTASLVDDLTAKTNTNYVDDFANCVSLGWRSIERSDTISFKSLTNLGTVWVNDAMHHKKPVRAYLAEYARRFLKAQ